MNTHEATEILDKYKKWREEGSPLSIGDSGMLYTPYQIGEALSHAIEVMKRSEWQPIETAPRDGTRIRCLVINDEFILHWEQEDDEYPAGWCDDDKTDWNPTHWMPLPDAPEVGDARHK